MSKRDRNRNGQHATACSCCDFPPSDTKRVRREAKRRERQGWKKEAEKA